MRARASETLARALPRGARELCAALRERGHEAWIVGGCVRDVLMGRAASDWDLASTALPREVQRIFRRTVPTGIDHGTITVLLGKEHYEVTTLRGESGYADGRRPDVVTFGTSIEEDLGRRDFTVNAIAYHPIADEIVDPYDGLGDIERRVIRAVRDPMERFAEDGLRVLRAARFVASLQFSLDAATEAAIRPNLSTYAKVSPERVREEWVKAFRATEPSRAFAVMRRTGMLAVHAAHLDRLDDASFARALARLDAAPREPLAARVAALVWTDDLAPVDAWLRELRFSNREREQTLLLLSQRAAGASEDLPSTRRTLRAIGRGNASWALEALEAIARGEGDAAATDRVRALRRRAEQVLAAEDPLDLKDLTIGGADVMAISGRAPGRWVGEVLDRLLDEVLDDPGKNDRATLLARAKDLLGVREAVGASGLADPRTSST